MAKKIKILIADDHPLFRKGLRDVIESNNSFQIINESGDGSAALENIIKLSPEIAILDIAMPGKTGLEVAEILLEQKDPVKLIILTMFDDIKIFNRAISLGVKGYLLKDSVAGDIISCISSVISGNFYVSPLISGYLIKQKKETVNEEVKDGLNKLTATEKKVLKLIAESKTSKEIAARLAISPKTVEHHRSNICAKLNLQGAYALLKYSLENKQSLIDQE